MNSHKTGTRKTLSAIALVCLFVLVLFQSGRFLIVDHSAHADVILVLAGETDRRPQHGLDLLTRGYAARIILDVPADTKIYQWTQPELAEKFIQQLPQAQSITICKIHGLSTLEEAREASPCLQRVGAKTVLLVTSDYHTRRAVSIFKHEIPDRDFSVTAAFDSRTFGTEWWRRREWAKTCLNEWAKLLWWEFIDRWR